MSCPDVDFAAAHRIKEKLSFGKLSQKRRTILLSAFGCWSWKSDKGLEWTTLKPSLEQT